MPAFPQQHPPPAYPSLPYEPQYAPEPHARDLPPPRPLFADPRASYPPAVATWPERTPLYTRQDPVADFGDPLMHAGAPPRERSPRRDDRWPDNPREEHLRDVRNTDDRPRLRRDEARDDRGSSIRERERDRERARGADSKDAARDRDRERRRDDEPRARDVREPASRVFPSFHRLGAGTASADKLDAADRAQESKLSLLPQPPGIQHSRPPLQQYSATAATIALMPAPVLPPTQLPPVPIAPEPVAAVPTDPRMRRTAAPVLAQTDSSSVKQPVVRVEAPRIVAQSQPEPTPPPIHPVPAVAQALQSLKSEPKKCANIFNHLLLN